MKDPDRFLVALIDISNGDFSAASERWHYSQTRLALPRFTPTSRAREFSSRRPLHTSSTTPTFD